MKILAVNFNTDKDILSHSCLQKELLRCDTSKKQMGFCLVLLDYVHVELRGY